MKHCRHCNKELLQNHIGLQCRPCRSYLNRYGINLVQRQELLESQNNKCKLCHKEVEFTRGKSNSAYIDHCHGTGKIRGILCHPCNTSLGYIENNLDLNSIMEYIS